VSERELLYLTILSVTDIV